MVGPSFLGRAYRLLAFDWDGTAVVGRSEDSTAVRHVIERLLRADVLIAVVTGTNVGNIEAQLSASIHGPHKSRLWLCTNRGSEVYGFHGASPPVLLYLRRATDDEDRKLTRIAEEVKAEIVARTGLRIDVITNRLNRRKIDLIPTLEWRDPPKSAIPELLVAVEARLRGAGLAGGLHEVFELAERTCRELGLPDARVTSDVKHIEIGLTDKSDSLRWVIHDIAEPRAIAAEDILVVGDEFGPTAGFPGSDDKMVIPEARGAAFVSVGREPAGVLPPVVHVGGGPARFRELLADQAELHPVALPLGPMSEGDWVIAEGPLVPSREHEVESVFSVGNGYIGSRGSLAEGSALSAPATFVAGVFDEPPESTMPELVVGPDWAHVQATIHGAPLSLARGEALEHRRVLDMRQGVLWREWRHRDDAGRVTRIRGLRFASLADRHLLGQSIAMTPENYGGDVAVEGAPELPLSVETHRGVQMAFAIANVLEEPRAFWRVPMAFTAHVRPGRTYRLDRVTCVDTAARPAQDGAAALQGATAHLEDVLAREGVEGIVGAHVRAWADVWRSCDVQVDGDAEAQLALRFAAYHLVSAADPDDEHVSIGARGLTGHGYSGHVFWDTDVYMLPFFIWTRPASARALVMYRFHTLPAARDRAQRMGYAGALYAWESADTGEDVTPAAFASPDGEVVRVFTGTREQHISADVAWAAWTYWQTTADDAFLVDAGAEILIETARFWASRAVRLSDAAYHIEGVEGPDEYHDLVDDDAYTNWMAQWNLERAAEVAELVARAWPERWRALAARLALDAEEPRRWRAVAARMYLGIDPSTGLVEQFRGYLALDQVDLAPYARRRTPMTVLLGRDRVARSQIIKQPDVVMILHLFPERLSPAARERNFRFYDARTDHGSSLSPAIHAAVAARLGDAQLGEQYFRQAAAIDLENDMGNAAAGVHMGALGGIWQAAVLGFAGLAAGPHGPTLSPRLPASWREISFAVTWRGQRCALSTIEATAAIPSGRALAAEAP